MIFSSRNEDGTPKWRLILEDIRVNGELVRVTRRLKPQPIGAIRAVQPNRTKKAVCIYGPCFRAIKYQNEFCGSEHPCYEPLKIKIIDCQTHVTWAWKRYFGFDKEANKEGFKSWDGLLNFFSSKKIDINHTQRIEFEKVND